MIKWNKKIITLLLFILIPLVLGIDECQPVMSPSQARNCQITSSWTYLNCSAEIMQVYNETGIWQINYTFQDYGNTSLCKTDWNISTLGTYNYVITSGDTGIILVEAQNMLSIIIGLISIAGIFLFLAVRTQRIGLKIIGYIISFIQILFISFLMYINELGDALNPILELNFKLLFIILGGMLLIYLFLIIFGIVGFQEEKEYLDMGENKWSKKNKW
jgi:hypothetical protein